MVRPLMLGNRYVILEHLDEDETGPRRWTVLGYLFMVPRALWGPAGFSSSVLSPKAFFKSRVFFVIIRIP